MRALLILCVVGCGTDPDPGPPALPPPHPRPLPPDAMLADAAPDAMPVAVAFADAVHYPAPYKPYVIRAADLDNDGHLDLVVAIEESSTIEVLRNDGHGGFAPIPAPTSYGFPTGEYPTGAELADLDHDGILDVITADYHGNSVSVLRGHRPAAGYTLDPAASYPTAAGAETSNLTLGDWNADGHLDVVATNPQAHSVSVFLGRGDGTLRPATNLALGDSEPYAVATADLDRDGHPDLAIADNRTGTIFIRLGNGDGTFRTPPTQPMVIGTSPFSIASADLNRDGFVDLVVGNRNSNDLDVLLGRGDGTFRAPLVAAAGLGPYSIAIADMNRDGIPDVLVADHAAGTVSLLLGTGDGSLGSPITTGPVGSYPYSVAAGDWNGDGLPDFATANAVSNDVAVKLSTAHPISP